MNTYRKHPAFLEPYKKGWQMADGGDQRQPAECWVKTRSRSRAMTAPTRATPFASPMNWRPDEGLNILCGTFLSNVGLAVTEFAGKKKIFFLAAEPLTDKIVWQNGNRYTFRLRASTYMQVAMLTAVCAGGKQETLGAGLSELRIRTASAAAFKQ